MRGIKRETDHTYTSSYSTPAHLPLRALIFFHLGSSKSVPINLSKPQTAGWDEIQTPSSIFFPLRHCGLQHGHSTCHALVTRPGIRRITKGQPVSGTDTSS